MSQQKLMIRGQEQMIQKPFVLPNPQISVHDNIQFMKKVSLVTISSISFLRNIFPPDAFSKRKLDGLSVNIIRNSDECPGTGKMMEWITSAFSVIEAKCLKKLILLIQKNNTDIPLESYSLNFTYDREAIHYALINESVGANEILSQSSVKCPSNIKKEVAQILRSMMHMVQGMKPLPEDCDLSMCLEFSENLPEDFKVPEHFKIVDSLSVEFPQTIMKMKLGSLDTKFMSLGVMSKSLLHEGMDEDEEYNEGSNLEIEDAEILPTPENSSAILSLRFNPRNTQNSAVEPLLQPNSSALFGRVSSHDVPELSEDNCTKPVLPSDVNLESKTTDLSDSTNLKSKEKVDCICMFKDEEIDGLTCSVCGTSQHKACYKVLRNETVEEHVCIKCHKDGRPCTTPELVDMADKKRKIDALMRRGLDICLVTPKVSINTFVTALRFPRPLAEKLFNCFDNQGCLEPGKRKIRAVNMEYLNNIMIPKHFKVQHKVDSMDEDMFPIETVSRQTYKRRKLYAKSITAMNT